MNFKSSKGVVKIANIMHRTTSLLYLPSLLSVQTFSLHCLSTCTDQADYNHELIEINNISDSDFVDCFVLDVFEDSSDRLYI